MAFKKLTESKIQEFADEFTNKVMTEEYGSRYSELENIEDDEELSEVWDELNEEFYTTMHNFI